MADTKIERPGGTIEDRMGTFTWSMSNNRVVVKTDGHITINTVEYQGDAHLEVKNGKWQAPYGNIWLRRSTGDLALEPTMNAWDAFRQKVQEIAESIATPENLHQAKIYDLNAEIIDSQEKIESLWGDMEDERKIIRERSDELAKFGFEFVARLS